jgi:hypothetical protein
VDVNLYAMIDMPPGRRRLIILVTTLAGAAFLTILIHMWGSGAWEERCEPVPRVREDAVWVSGASMRGLQPEDLKVTGRPMEPGNVLLGGHRVEPGDRTVLIWRAYDDDIRSFDEEGFEMLTVELVSPALGTAYALPSEAARAFYSGGSPVWGMGSYSASVRGVVELVTWNPTGPCEAILRLEAAMVATTRFDRAVQELVRIEKRLRLTPKHYTELDPWLKGTSPRP